MMTFVGRIHMHLVMYQFPFQLYDLIILNMHQNSSKCRSKLTSILLFLNMINAITCIYYIIKKQKLGYCIHNVCRLNLSLNDGLFNWLHGMRDVSWLICIWPMDPVKFTVTNRCRSSSLSLRLNSSTFIYRCVATRSSSPCSWIAMLTNKHCASVEFWSASGRKQFIMFLHCIFFWFKSVLWLGLTHFHLLGCYCQPDCLVFMSLG